MAVKLRNGVIDIDKIQIDNAILAEYLAGLPESRREEAIIKAIGIGVLAEIKGEIAQFLNETEGELGKHLASLKTLYELRELRFKETSGKGEKAEQQIMQALADIQTAASFNNDEIVDLSKQRGQHPRSRMAAWTTTALSLAMTSAPSSFTSPWVTSRIRSPSTTTLMPSGVSSFTPSNNVQLLNTFMPVPV